MVCTQSRLHDSTSNTRTVQGDAPQSSCKEAPLFFLAVGQRAGRRDAHKPAHQRPSAVADAAKAGFRERAGAATTATIKHYTCRQVNDGCDVMRTGHVHYALRREASLDFALDLLPLLLLFFGCFDTGRCWRWAVRDTYAWRCGARLPPESRRPVPAGFRWPLSYACSVNYWYLSNLDLDSRHPVNYPPPLVSVLPLNNSEGAERKKGQREKYGGDRERKALDFFYLHLLVSINDLEGKQARLTGSFLTG